MPEYDILRPEPKVGTILPVRLGGRLHVPACGDCEEPSKCCVFGCAWAAVHKTFCLAKSNSVPESGSIIASETASELSNSKPEL